MKTERLAWGFSHLFDDVSTVTTALCVVLWRVISEVALFIIVTHRGINKLSEGEQQWVDELFQRYGYAVPRVYDNYQTCWK